jgi:hypothetical protein
MNGRSRRDTWIYVFAIIGVLVAVYVLYSLLTAGLQAYIALIAGVMLLIGNIPDLVRSLQQRELGTAMMNTLIGLALVTYFLGALLPWLFYPLSILLLVAAAPLAINRVGVTRAYVNAGRAIASQARHLLRLRQRTF